MTQTGAGETDTGAAAMRRYFAELIGMFIFMLAVFGAFVSESQLAPLGIGAALMVMVYAGGHVSGGHFNPAVSISAWLRGRLPAADLGPYIASQLVGALVAYLVALGIWGDALNTAGAGLDLDGQVLAAFLGELVFTFALCYVVLTTTGTGSRTGSGTGSHSRPPAGSEFSGLAIGLTMTVGGVAVGGISGAALNPALAFGLSIGGLFVWKWIWVYLLAQVIAAVLAAAATRALTPENP
ncbi:MAG: MIP/aquaporin family protein [Nocardioidaceae bacterium]